MDNELIDNLINRRASQYSDQFSPQDPFSNSYDQPVPNDPIIFDLLSLLVPSLAFSRGGRIAQKSSEALSRRRPIDILKETRVNSSFPAFDKKAQALNYYATDPKLNADVAKFTKRGALENLFERTDAGIENLPRVSKYNYDSRAFFDPDFAGASRHLRAIDPLEDFINQMQHAQYANRTNIGAKIKADLERDEMFKRLGY